MKLIRNVTRRRIEKAKARTRRDYLDEYNKRIAELEQIHADQIDKMMSQHEKILAYKQSQHEKELLSVREDERRNYTGRIEEANAEISRLRIHISGLKDQEKMIQDREYQLSETIRSVSDKFFRGINKMQEAYQLIEFAKGDAESFERKYLKYDKKPIREV